MDICRQYEPSFTDVGDGHRIACFLYDEVEVLNEEGQTVAVAA